MLKSARPADQPSRALQIVAGDGIQTPRISPDGGSVVYVQHGKLFVRALDSFESRELEGTDGASRPFWSPDSESIGFFAPPRELHAISAKGGKSRVIATDVFAPFGGAWCAAGLVFERWQAGMWVTPDGGQPHVFSAPDPSAPRTQLQYPSCLPDGRLLANWDNAIVVTDGKTRTPLYPARADAIADPVYVKPDTVLFTRSGANVGIWRLPVAADLSAATGPPVPVLPEAHVPSVGPNGQFVALTGVQIGPRQLVWVDRAGKVLSTFGKPQRQFASIVVVGDGSRVSAVAPGPNGGVGFWIHRDTTMQALAVNQSIGGDLEWSPTGDRVAFDGSAADGKQGVFVRSAAGAGAAQFVTEGRNPIWTPDGRSLIFERGGASREQGVALWIVGVGDGAAPRLLLDNAMDPAISADGRLLAYDSFATGEPETYVTTMPPSGDVVPISSDGGRHPRWNPRGGGELFYLSGPIVGSDPNAKRDVSAAQIDARGALKVTRNEKLFDADALGLVTTFQGFRGYDVAPDGQRLIVQTTGAEGTPTIALIDDLANWMRVKQK